MKYTGHVVKGADKLLKCAEGHLYQPGAVRLAIDAFNALPPHQKAKAEATYDLLIAERKLPLRNREQMNKDAKARRELENRRDLVAA